MAYYFKFGDKKLLRIKLSIHASARITEVFSLLKQIEMSGINSQSIIYAIIELISNSLRAQREKGIKTPVTLIMEIKNNTLLIMIKDNGGGFDIKALPYDINKPAEEIDTTSPEFTEYRKKNNNKHFGLGLYIAKKIFNKIDIRFFDQNETETQEFKADTKGTIIRCSLALGENNDT